MPSQFYFPPYNPTLQYQKFDVVYGINLDGTTYVSPYFYSTQSSLGQTPSGFASFGLTQYSRSDDVTTVTFVQTGSIPNFQAGSLIQVSAVAANPSVEYTGMVIAGGNGWASYINAGWPQTQSTSGIVSCIINPAWTTGFMFVPSFSTKMDSENKTFTAKLGDLYEQRMAVGINTYDKSFSMTFQSRSDRETRSIINFVQDAGGVRPFPLLFPVSMLENQPNHKYVAPTVSYTTDSWGLNTISVNIRRVFDL